MKSTFFPHFTIGVDAYDAIPDICLDYGKTAVIVGGEKSRAAAEPLIRKAIEGKIELLGSFQYGDDATFENAEALTRIPEIRKADMVFAVGGGRATDTAKWATHLLKKPLFTFPTLAKQYEVPFSARGMDLTWVQETGVRNAQNVAPGILKYGKAALEAVDKGIVTDALEPAILSIIVAPGMASVCIEDDLDSSLAHAIYNSHTRTPHKGNHLHGAVVNYGLQVMLTMDGQIEERDKIYRFAKSIGLPHCLADIGIDPAHPDELVENCLHTKDMRVKPYDITFEMVYRAMMELEKLK